MRILCIALALALAGPAPVFSDPQAQQLFERANERYAADDFAGASEALAKAYELEPIATLLYSRAQVERRQQRWREAAELYQAYLDTRPPEEETVHARRHLLFSRAQASRIEDDCEQAIALYDEYVQRYPDSARAEDARAGREACQEALALAPARDVVETDVAIADEPAPAPVPAPRPAPERSDESAPPWYRSVAGGVLAGVGGVGIATGAILVGVAYRDHRLAADEPTHDSASLRYQTARTREIAGVVTFAVSGAALVFAAIAYGVASRKSEPKAGISFEPTGLRGRF